MIQDETDMNTNTWSKHPFFTNKAGMIKLNDYEIYVYFSKWKKKRKTNKISIMTVNHHQHQSILPDIASRMNFRFCPLSAAAMFNASVTLLSSHSLTSSLHPFLCLPYPLRCSLSLSFQFYSSKCLMAYYVTTVSQFKRLGSFQKSFVLFQVYSI